MKKELKIYGEFHYNGINSFFFFIMSHGTEERIYNVNGDIIKFKTVLHYFSATNSPGLARKPRIFFPQACRGNLNDKGTDNYSTKTAKMITKSNMRVIFYYFTLVYLITRRYVCKVNSFTRL